MGGCASKPKESEILETPATTEKAVVEAVSQEKADEIVAEKKEESAGDGADTQKDAELSKQAQAEPAPEEVVKTAAAKEAAIETAENKKASGETESPKQEEAAPTNDTKTNEEPLVTLRLSQPQFVL